MSLLHIKTQAQQGEQTWGSFLSVPRKSPQLGSEGNEKLSVRGTNESVLLAIYSMLTFFLLCYNLCITHLQICTKRLRNSLTRPYFMPRRYLCAPASSIITEVSHGVEGTVTPCAREKDDGRARSSQKLIMGDNASSSAFSCRLSTKHS